MFLDSRYTDRTFVLITYCMIPHQQLEVGLN